MKHFVFLQSVSAREYEAGKVLYDHLMDNPCIEGEIYPVIEFKAFEDIMAYINNMVNTIDVNDKIVFFMDIHSDERTFTLKDIRSQNREDFTEYHPWEQLNDILESLNKRFGRNALVIFVSCYSSVYFSAMKSPHVYIIAAEGKINPIRANHMLTVLYDEFCKSSNTEKAYEEMIKKYPLEVEAKKKDGFKAVLKLYK